MRVDARERNSGAFLFFLSFDVFEIDMRANARYLSRATERDGEGVVFGKKKTK